MLRHGILLLLIDSSKTQRKLLKLSLQRVTDALTHNYEPIRKLHLTTPCQLLYSMFHHTTKYLAVYTKTRFTARHVLVPPTALTTSRLCSWNFCLTWIHYSNSSIHISQQKPAIVISDAVTSDATPEAVIANEATLYDGHKC